MLFVWLCLWTHISQKHRSDWMRTSKTTFGTMRYKYWMIVPLVIDLIQFNFFASSHVQIQMQAVTGAIGPLLALFCMFWSLHAVTLYWYRSFINLWKAHSIFLNQMYLYTTAKFGTRNNKSSTIRKRTWLLLQHSLYVDNYYLKSTNTPGWVYG